MAEETQEQEITYKQINKTINGLMSVILDAEKHHFSEDQAKAMDKLREYRDSVRKIGYERIRKGLELLRQEEFERLERLRGSRTAEFHYRIKPGVSPDSIAGEAARLTVNVRGDFMDSINLGALSRVLRIDGILTGWETEDRTLS